MIAIIAVANLIAYKLTHDGMVCLWHDTKYIFYYGHVHPNKVHNEHSQFSESMGNLHFWQIHKAEEKKNKHMLLCESQ